MPQDQNFDSDQLIFENIPKGCGAFKRIGRLKGTGIVVLESILDERGREVERTFFDDHGQLTKRIIYEYDDERRPRLITAFDRMGNVVMRQERGKPPVFS